MGSSNWFEEGEKLEVLENSMTSCVGLCCVDVGLN